MSFLIPFLKFRRFRFWWVKIRYKLLKGKMKFFEGGSSNIGEKTIKHNLSAFDTDAAYGCGERMAFLIYPVIAFYSYYTIKKSERKILIVGARTEDDIYWMRSYGFTQTVGLDLFSYSDNIMIGDIHKTNFDDASFDVVLLGWMISYSKDPAKVIKECRRILKPGGLIGIGLDHNNNPNLKNVDSPRVNTLNCSADIIKLLDSTISHKVLFEYDHYNDQQNDFSTSVVSICN